MYIESNYTNTVYGPLNDWIQLFESDPLPHVYKIKHLAIQSAFTSICEKIGYSEELQ